MSLVGGALWFGAGGLALHAFDRVRVAAVRPRGLPGSLPWAYFIRPGVIQLKDGAFQRSFRLRGPDASSATYAELNALPLRFNRALHPLHTRWRIHVDAVRRASHEYLPPGAFPDRVTRGIDREREQQYAHSGRKYETEVVLTATYLPPPDGEASVRRLFVHGERNDTPWEAHLGRFLEDTDQLASQLASVVEVEPLGSDAMLTHLHFCVNGLEQRVLAPSDASFLDHVLASQEFRRGTRPRIGDKHVYAVSIFGFPPQSWSGILDPLTKLGARYRWSTRVILLGQGDAARILSRMQDRWFKSRQGAASLRQSALRGRGEKSQQEIEDDKLFENPHARQAAARMGDVLGKLQMGGGRLALYTSTLVVHADTAEEGRETARRLANEVRDLGFAARVEGLHACAAFLSSMPGDGWHNLRRPPLPSENIADLLPLTASWAGPRYVASPYFPVRSPALACVDTDDSTPFRLSLYHKDVGHSLLVGATGAGKSTFMGFTVAQYMRYPAAQVFWFDKGHSAFLLTAAMGGMHYDIRPRPDPRNGLQFQPLALVDRAEELAWAAEWIETTVELQGIAPSLARRNAIQRALRVLGDRPPEERTIRGFTMHVQDVEIRHAMEQYTGTGPYGLLLDGARDGFAEGDVHTFEMGRLTSMGDRIVVPTLLHLFRQIELRLRSNRPTFIPIDEAWEHLMRSLFARKIEQWLREIRKANGAVMLATQDPADIAQSEHREILLSSCPSKIFLPNRNAVAHETAKLYRAYNLNDREIEIIAGGESKRDYFFKSPDGSRKFDLKLGPVALAFLGSRPGLTTAAAVERAQRLRDTHGAAWAHAWLEEAGLEDAAREMFPTPALAAVA